MITYSHIIDRIITAENLETKDVFSKSRKAELVECRHIIWTVARKFTPLSHSKLGIPFDCDHATVLHGIRKIQDLVTNEMDLAEKIQRYTEYFENFDPEAIRQRTYKVGNLFWMRKKLHKKFRIYK